MRERSVVTLYAIVAIIVLAFYVGPYRHATNIISQDTDITTHDEVAIAADRRLLLQASSLRSLQTRVQKAIRSPLQADNFGTGQALFFERLQTLSRREGITLKTIEQSQGAPVKSKAALSSLPISVTVIGKLSGVLRFLSSIDASVGLVDLGRIDIRPATDVKQGTNSVVVRVDGTFLKIATQNESRKK